MSDKDKKDEKDKAASFTVEESEEPESRPADDLEPETPEGEEGEHEAEETEPIYKGRPISSWEKEAERKQRELERLRDEKDQVWSVTQQMLSERQQQQTGSQPSQGGGAPNVFTPEDREFFDREGVSSAALERIGQRFGSVLDGVKQSTIQVSVARHDADIISSVDDLIEKHDELTDYREEMIRSVGGIDPVMRLNYGARVLADNAMKIVRANHFDELAEARAKAASSEARKNRKIRGEAGSSGMAGGKGTTLTKDEARFLEQFNSNRPKEKQMTAEQFKKQLGSVRAQKSKD